MSLRVLVVDDHSDTRLTMRLLLRSWACEAHEAADGHAAIKAAAEFRPHIILLDLAMPGLDGYEVARRLRQDVGFKDVLLVAVSGLGGQQDVARCREAGFDRHLLKPVDLTLFKELVEGVTPFSSAEPPARAFRP